MTQTAEEIWVYHKSACTMGIWWVYIYINYNIYIIIITIMRYNKVTSYLGQVGNKRNITTNGHSIRKEFWPSPLLFGGLQRHPSIPMMLSLSRWPKQSIQLNDICQLGIYIPPSSACSWNLYTHHIPIVYLIYTHCIPDIYPLYTHHIPKLINSGLNGPETHFSSINYMVSDVLVQVQKPASVFTRE